MRYFLGFLISIGLIIVLIFLLFHGGSKPKVPATSKALTSYATTDAAVRLTMDAPVNAEQEHQQIRVTIDQTQVTYEQITGYNGVVTKQQHFTNNQSAYDTFLHALDHAGFTKGKTDKALQDERGYCPTGDRFIFELLQNGEQLEKILGHQL